MKKQIAMILALCLCISMLVACGAGSEETTTAATTVPTTVATTEPETEPTTVPTTAPVELMTYPLNQDSTYARLAQSLPDIIYNTYGSENGLGGTIYKFSGTVVDYFTNGSNGWTFENIVVDTGDGTVMITDFYSAIYNASVLEVGPEVTKAYYPYDVDNFVLPSVGETANFITVYAGYSMNSEMASFYLGANKSLYEMAGIDDPVVAMAENPLMAAELKEAPVWNGSGTEIIGYRGYIEITKAELKSITVDDYKLFCETVVDDSGYNWITIICDDGTGVQFTSSLYRWASYGTIDDEGIIITELGSINKTGDSFEYESFE